MYGLGSVLCMALNDKDVKFIMGGGNFYFAFCKQRHCNIPRGYLINSDNIKIVHQTKFLGRKRSRAKKTKQKTKDKIHSSPNTVTHYITLPMMMICKIAQHSYIDSAICTSTTGD